MYFLFSIRGLKTDTTVHLLMKRARRQKMFKNKAAHRKRMAGMFSKNIHITVGSWVRCILLPFPCVRIAKQKYTDIMCKICNDK